MRFLASLLSAGVFLVLSAAPQAFGAPSMGCAPGSACAPWANDPDPDETEPEEPERIVGIESEVVDPETGDLWITFITAGGERIVVSFGVRQEGTDPFPEPVQDIGNPAGDAPCVTAEGEYGC